MNGCRARGFTLLEVVIAFAILGLSLAVLYGAFSNALSRMRRDAELSEATLVAQSLLSRAAVETSEASDGEWNGFNFRLTQQAVTASYRQPSVTIPTQRVTARVWWVGSHGPREIELSTLRLVRRTPP